MQTSRRIENLTRNKDAFQSIQDFAFTAEGLLKCSEVIQTNAKSKYHLCMKCDNSIYFNPNNYSSPVYNYISKDKHLWNISAIRVVPEHYVYGRAPMFGVPFEKALSIVLKEGFIKAEFFIPDKKDNVFYAALMFHINKHKDSNGANIELQVWQYCPGLSEVFYIHSESPDFLKYITHLDGAVIQYHPKDIYKLFTSGRKIKGEQYEKQFRLDGIIPFTDMINIISAYLPVEELVDEAFQIRKAE